MLRNSAAAPNSTKHVLLCGHRAFSARGLRQLLSTGGCQVTQFSRGEDGQDEQALLGPVNQVHSHPRLDQRYDAVINFIVLINAGLEENLAYLRSLLQLCAERSVTHLIHISSMSVYPDSTRCYTEQAPIKPPPQPARTYADMKTAAEYFLLQQASPDLRLSLLRPAYILGTGHPNPVGSVGMRTLGGRLLVLGRGDRQRAVISRPVLHSALLHLVHAPPQERCEALLMVDRESPTSLEYLQACCDVRGLGTRALSLPALLWVPFFLAREVQRGPFAMRRFLRAVAGRASLQRYDPAQTEARLGMSLHADWRADLVAGEEIGHQPGQRG
jgi:nucleoside-diphosphate-sugar epimerase